MSASVLEILADKYGTDKLVHGYCPFYERHLASLRDDHFTLLELGIWEGASLLTWVDYFTEAQIIGVDIGSQKIPHHERITVVTSDFHDYTPTAELGVIIDDASHNADDMVAAYTMFWPYLSAGGWYVIEDWRTQFELPEYGYNSSPQGSVATSMAHDLMDDVLHEDGGQVVEVHAYPQILFIQKRF